MESYKMKVSMQDLVNWEKEKGLFSFRDGKFYSWFDIANIYGLAVEGYLREDDVERIGIDCFQTKRRFYRDTFDECLIPCYTSEAYEEFFEDTGNDFVVEYYKINDKEAIMFLAFAN